MLQQFRGKCTVVIAIGMALLLSGASRGSEKAPAGKVIVALSPQTTATVDPALSGGASDFVNLETMYNRLTETPKDSLENVPGVATEWTMSSDGLTWEFKIRKGVRFHNGEEMTPEDVAFSILRVPTVSRPNIKARHNRFVKSVEATEDSVIIHLKIPEWTFVEFISNAPYSIVPKKYIEKVGNDGFLKAPVGTGPFKFVAWAKQEFLKLEAVDYKHFLWQPGVKELEYRIVPEESTRLAMVRTGEADLAQVSVRSLRTIEAESKLRAIKVPYIGGLYLYMFGQHDPRNPLSKTKVRKALSLAIDRQAIADGIYRGYARPTATGIWNPNRKWWPEWGFDAPKQDLDKAKKLLAEAGFPGGGGLRLTLHNYEYGTLPLWTQVAPVLQVEWQKLGIKVDLRQWEWGGYAPMARGGKFKPVAISTHISNGSGLKGNMTNFTGTGLYAHASGTADGAHPELRKLADQFDQELDPNKREELREKIFAYDRENVVFIPVVAQDALWVAGPRLAEYTPRPGTITSGNMWTIKARE